MSRYVRTCPTSWGCTARSAPMALATSLRRGKGSMAVTCTPPRLCERIETAKSPISPAPTTATRSPATGAVGDINTGRRRGVSAGW